MLNEKSLNLESSPSPHSYVENERIETEPDDKENNPSISLTPMKAIRAKCRGCGDNANKNIQNCPINTCPLFLLRDGHRPIDSRPLKSIRKYCLSCCGGKSHEITKCHNKNCPLHDYRFGRLSRMPVLARKQPLQLWFFTQTPAKATQGKASK